MAGGSSTLSIGLSGLFASQRAMDTISHNIANVNTPGYSRQRVDLASRTPQWSADQFFGNGVDVTAVTRTYDSFLTRDLQINTSAAADQQTQYELAVELDAVLGNAETALSPVMQDFFNSLDNAAADPSSVTAREIVLNKADQLAERFGTLDTRFQQLDSAVQTRTRADVDEINSMARAIADLNRQIITNGGTVSRPNDLLDQRDELVARLSEKIAVTTTIQDDGAMNVFVGTGQSLIMGTENRELRVTAGGDDAGRLGISIAAKGGTAVDITSEISGGSLGGMLEFEHGMLSDAQRRMDQLALAMAQEINAQHRLGMDLNGELGGDFFSDTTETDVQSSTSSNKITVTVDSIDELANSDYRLLRTGGQYTLVRLSDNTATTGTLSEVTAGTGFSIFGTVEDGDSFFIRAAAGSARRLERAVPDAASLALASPVRGAAVLGNQGDASIGGAHVTALADPAGALGTEITLTYDTATQQFIAVDADGNPLGSVGYDPSADSGAPLTLTVSGLGDISFTVKGSPASGDTFTIANNAGGSSDNGNALAMSELQRQRLLAGGTATFAETYARAVADTASRTQGLQLAATAHAKLLSNAQDARDSYSGVNLDEEAANLIRFQQAYQASAKVIAATSQLFQILLDATGS